MLPWVETVTWQKDTTRLGLERFIKLEYSAYSSTGSEWFARSARLLDRP